MTKGLEELTKKGYVDPSEPSKLKPEAFGSAFRRLLLGDTTFGVLGKYLELDFFAADEFETKFYKKPANPKAASPDDIIIKGASVIAVQEHKSPGELKKKKDLEAHIEQLYFYMLLTKAKIGVLTDGINNYWLHNLDRSRFNVVKRIEDHSGFYGEFLSPKTLQAVLKELSPSEDKLTPPEIVDPSYVAQSVWQSIYVATRKSPEKCFQTFVELFMYKLISEYELLPSLNRIGKLTIDPARFEASYGEPQIVYYLGRVRPAIKKSFPELGPILRSKGLVSSTGKYRATRELIETLISGGGEASIINGHAFEDTPEAHNLAFVKILRRLDAFDNIRSLDPGFKSRIYEQFLRRDLNTTKVSGKYFTPRNIVKAVVKLADVASLPPDAVICDPACGVGGFLTETLLEWARAGIQNFSELADGSIRVDRKLIGLEVQHDIVCLAKANFLLHTIEFFSDLSASGRKNYQKLLAETFIQSHEDGALGSLYHTPVEKYQLVMANPPYVVSGTQEVTRRIRTDPRLSSFYGAGGSGLESRFVNNIVGSLQPGGRAFIILPKSMLARVETGIKSFILENCIVDALIYLPSRTFYTTPNETYILCLTKKQNQGVDQVDPVLVYYVREIGETRDMLRKPTDNDLPTMIDAFKTFKANKQGYSGNDPLVKVVSFDHLSPSGRWDFDYLWTPDELAELGVVDAPVKTFEGLRIELESLISKIDSTEKTLQKFGGSSVSFVDVKLASTYFEVFRGDRVVKKEVDDHPGNVPIVASSRFADSYFGFIDRDYLERKFGFEAGILRSGSRKILTVGATGAVGAVHLRTEEVWFLHDDAMAVEIVSEELDAEYVKFALQEAIEAARFDYSAKLYEERLLGLEIKVPVDAAGAFDLERQRQLAEAFRVKSELDRKVKEFGKELQMSSLKLPN